MKKKTKKEARITMGKATIIVTTFLFLLSTTPLSACSVSCDTCLIGKCQCASDCKNGLMSIYASRCKGIPKYEIPIIAGIVKWSPSQEGEYYSKLLCDDGDKSLCEKIVVPTVPKEEEGEKRISGGGDYFPFMAILAIVLALLYGAYNYFNK